MRVGTILIAARAPKEDAILQREFGQEWEVWAQKTRYKIIPWIF